VTGAPEVGTEAPGFTLAADGGREVALSDLRGRKVALYFYPKDDTPGCAREARDFRDAAAGFAAAGAEILGVSRDGPDRHDRFKAKHGLPFALLSDVDGVVCAAYGTWVEKSLYGRKFMGIERSTFLIDGSGVIRAAWRKVRVPGHVVRVLEAARAL